MTASGNAPTAPSCPWTQELNDCPSQGPARRWFPIRPWVSQHPGLYSLDLAKLPDKKGLHRGLYLLAKVFGLSRKIKSGESRPLQIKGVPGTRVA